MGGQPRGQTEGHADSVEARSPELGGRKTDIQASQVAGWWVTGLWGLTHQCVHVRVCTCAPFMHAFHLCERRATVR